jgi:hypothetical protein
MRGGDVWVHLAPRAGRSVQRVSRSKMSRGRRKVATPAAASRRRMRWSGHEDGARGGDEGGPARRQFATRQSSRPRRTGCEEIEEKRSARAPLAQAHNQVLDHETVGPLRLTPRRGVRSVGMQSLTWVSLDALLPARDASLSSQNLREISSVRAKTPHRP